MRLLRIALNVSLGMIALGFLGFAAGIVTLGILYPAGNPQLSSPQVLMMVAAAAALFVVVGAVASLAIGSAIRTRQNASRERSAPSIAESSAALPAVHDRIPQNDAAVAQFRPMGLGLTRGRIPTSSSLPWGQRLSIHPDGLEMRNLFEKAWIPRDRILGLYPMPGGFRVVWADGLDESSATLSAWLGITKIRTTMEKTGYRFDPE